ncbi:MAG: cysteine desulfurase NifS [Lachnospiraceae bacterium]|nr:cysteine desulfurase NifS [Lachnospiraceae bacterium]
MNIYADNAATTKMSPAAIDAMLPYFDKIYGNPSSLHSPGQRAAEALEQARETIAQTLGCGAKELYFTSGGSEADNQALLSAAAIGERKGKKHIISSSIEHHAVLHTLERLKKRGFEITLLDAHENGIVRPEELAEALRPDTVLVSVMYANNEIGTLQPISELGKLCRERGVLFHTDAVQAVGHVKINVAEENIDLLSLSAHKFHGPKGVGALYARKGIVLTNLIDGGAQERGKRAGTENLPAIVGMAAALREAAGQLEEATAKLLPLRDRLISGLLEIPHTVLNGDAKLRLPGNVNVCFEGIEGESLLLLLDQKGIAASSGSACTSGSLDPSHVLLAIGRPHEIAHGSLRLSLSEENTPEEIAYMISSIREVVAYLRGMSTVWRDLQEGKRSYVIQ